MLVEVQPGTYLNPDDVVAITETDTHHRGRITYTSYVVVRSGGKFQIDNRKAWEVRAILWPDTPSTKRLTENN